MTQNLDRYLLPLNCNIWRFLAALKENLIATEKLSPGPMPKSTKHPQGASQTLHEVKVSDILEEKREGFRRSEALQFIKE